MLHKAKTNLLIRILNLNLQHFVYLFTAFYCPNPGVPVGGYMENANVRFQKKDTVRYACNRNYDLIGSAERQCQESGSWSGEAPTCQGTDGIIAYSQITDSLKDRPSEQTFNRACNRCPSLR